ncbi:unnamed protein product [Phytophthora fragariaefolia]|uniref:Unnamed protein product n=1 Tax=Phytophthora fragariaefolia TaxID=1490495 RepID=A0A9W6WY61_9STRA|nr:unnamed protein product [Phytophthora fragariaefolia]
METRTDGDLVSLCLFRLLELYTCGQEVKRSRGQEVKRSRGQEAKRSRGQEVKRSRGQEVKRSRGQEVKRSRGQEVKRSRGQEDKRSRCQDVPLPARAAAASGWRPIRTVDVVPERGYSGGDRCCVQLVRGVDDQRQRAGQGHVDEEVRDSGNDSKNDLDEDIGQAEEAERMTVGSGRRNWRGSSPYKGKLSIAIEVARAVSYAQAVACTSGSVLHSFSQPLLGGNLSSRKGFLDCEWNVELGDFVWCSAVWLWSSCETHNAIQRISLPQQHRQDSFMGRRNTSSQASGEAVDMDMTVWTASNDMKSWRNRECERLGPGGSVVETIQHELPYLALAS